MLNNLMLALQTDPDLYTLPRDHLGSIMRSLYISTGYDYISYIKTFGKATILTNFTQHANFINGTVNNGTLYQTDPDNKENGFLSFMRLVGTCYFKKHIATFIANYGHSTPTLLFNSINNN